MSTNITVCWGELLFLFISIDWISRDHTDKVLSVQFNWDYIVSGSTDKTIKVKFNELKSR
jgi:WD40 repeat protein